MTALMMTYFSTHFLVCVSLPPILMAEPEVKKPDDVPEAVKETEKPVKVSLVMSQVDRLLLDRIESYLLLTTTFIQNATAHQPKFDSGAN